MLDEEKLKTKIRAADGREVGLVKPVSDAFGLEGERYLPSSYSAGELKLSYPDILELRKLVLELPWIDGYDSDDLDPHRDRLYINRELAGLPLMIRRTDNQVRVVQTHG